MSSIDHCDWTNSLVVYENRSEVSWSVEPPFMALAGDPFLSSGVDPPALGYPYARNHIPSRPHQQATQGSERVCSLIHCLSFLHRNDKA